jgi:CubicO group peptidase (beta-lactamase class C family)
MKEFSVRRRVKILTYAFVNLLLLVARAGNAQIPTELDNDIAKAVRDWEVPGLAIVIVKDDHVVATKGYGVRELGKPGLVDGETIFDIASLTKSFTAAGAAVLVDAGELSWDDKVCDRLPNVHFGDPYIDREVTLRDLLSHRTGLQPANATFYFFGFDRNEILNCVQFLETQRPFRTSMLYSNVLYTVAGEMTAAAAKTTWADLIRKRVIEPAGMRFTAVETRPRGSNVAHPHALVDGVQKPIPPFDYTMVGPSASVFTNAVDLARWLRLHLNDGTLDGTQVISRASMVEMHSPQTIIQTTPEMRAARNVEFFGGYGLGWQIMDYRGEPLLWHSGNADGMPSYMALLPKQKLGIAVMMNTWAAGYLHAAIATRIMDGYLDIPVQDWSGDLLARHQKALAEETEDRKSVAMRKSAASKPAHALKDYAGTYRATLWGDIHVRLEGDNLTIQFGKGEKARLTPSEEDTFFLEWSDPVLRTVFYSTEVSIRPSGDGSAQLEVTLNRDRIDATRER